MARIKLLPIEPLELEFKDGTIKIALFNNEAFIRYTEEFGDILIDIGELEDEKISEDERQDKTYDVMSKILYCGLKVRQPTTTLEEAKNILNMGGNQLIMEITAHIIRNFDMSSNEETKKKLYQMLTEEQKKILRELNLI